MEEKPNREVNKKDMIDFCHMLSATKNHTLSFAIAGIIGILIGLAMGVGVCYLLSLLLH